MSEDVPSLQVARGLHNSLIEEDKHGLLVVLLRNKSAEADPTDIVPHLEAVCHGARVTGANRDILDRAGRAVVGGCVCVVKHTRHQRVLLALIPLTQENRPQCLAEESLTLDRDGVCCPPSARLTR